MTSTIANEEMAAGARASVVEDMSITLLAGRIKSSAPVIGHAREAERLGFKRAWLPERYNIKEGGVMFGTIAASTDHIGVGSGPMSAFSRPPIVTAAIGATMQSCFGDRFILGLGRSEARWIGGHGFGQATFRGIIDYARIVKQLWAGETVNYEGPAGKFEDLRMIDLPEAPPPKIVYFHVGGPKASRAAADAVWDQIALCNMTSADVVGRSIRWTKEEVERQGRDPDSLYFIAPVTVAADVSDEETRELVAARFVQGVQLPQLGKALIELNGWEEDWVNEIRNHPLVANTGKRLLDHAHHREGMLGPAELVPERWMRKSAAIGTAAEVCDALELYIEAGAHEIDIYAGTPAQNAGVIAEWRRRKQASR